MSFTAPYCRQVDQGASSEGPISTSPVPGTGATELKLKDIHGQSLLSRWYLAVSVELNEIKNIERVCLCVLLEDHCAFYPPF